MRLIAEKINNYLGKSSWIRKMFEAGLELKARHGAQNVFDFSLGNPDLPPPPQIAEGLANIAQNSAAPFAIGYMPNSGYPDTRRILAEKISSERETAVSADDLIITCGAAGGINAFFHSVLEPGEEVICPAPYFVEYGFYVDNHGGQLKPVKTEAPQFNLNPQKIGEAITDKTRAVLINSPNNPTGAIYSEESIIALTEILKEANENRERPIFLISDEPYRFLAYDGTPVPSVLRHYPYSVEITSFSKNLSLAGERIGYVLLNPEMPGKETLMNALVFSNRVLGFVNAPAIGQKLLSYALNASVDANIYAGRREAMNTVLVNAGYNFAKPRGGFYFFVEAPGGDDIDFVRILSEHLILAVPGTGFGYPGFFRLAFCVDRTIIERSAPGFAAAIKQIK